MLQKPDLGEGWNEAIGPEFAKPYMQRLSAFLHEEQKAGHIIYPKPSNMFRAFTLTPLEKVRVVILGQDPYHGPGQATGLAFSVPEGVALPPSLRNIYQEIEQELDITIPVDVNGKKSGDLTQWAEQGVLLLNTSLSVRAHLASSHAGRGWETFTDTAISAVDKHHAGVVFLLWGSHAQNKRRLIEGGRQYIFKAPHPSPLSAYRGFFGCGHFQKTNECLQQQGQPPIDWART